MQLYTAVEDLNDELDMLEFEKEENDDFNARHPIALRAGITYSEFKRRIIKAFEKNYSFSDGYLVEQYQIFVTGISLTVPDCPDPVQWFLLNEGW